MTNVVIIDGEKYGLSPAEKDFNVNVFGSIESAVLTVNFGTSFGYGLTGVILNGTKLVPKNDSLYTGDVAPLLKQGGNHITIEFNAVQFLGYPLGSAVISANLLIEGGVVVTLPSISQKIKDVENWVSANKTTFVVLSVVGMVGAVSLAFLASRLPSFGGVKVNRLPNSGDLSHAASSVSEHISNAAHSVKEKLT